MLSALLTAALLSSAPPKPEACSEPPVVIPLRGVIGPQSLPFRIEFNRAVADQAKEIIVDIDSPGGDVGMMFRIIDDMKAARAGGAFVTCRVSGMAASAAGIILESGCSQRTMVIGAQLMFHEVITGDIGGHAGDLRSAADELDDLDQRVATLIAWRLHMTVEQYRAWIHQRTRWLDAAQALKLGIIDNIEPTP